MTETGGKASVARIWHGLALRRILWGIWHGHMLRLNGNHLTRVWWDGGVCIGAR